MKKGYSVKMFVLSFIVSPNVLGILLLIGLYVDDIFTSSIREGKFFYNWIKSMRFDFIIPIIDVLHIVIPVYLLLFFLWVWYEYMKKVFLSKLCASQTPIDASEIFLPIIISFGYYIVVWIISSFATGYSIDGSSGAPGVFFIITLPYLFMLLHLSFLWVQQLFPVAVSLLTGLIIAATMLAKHRTKFQIVYDKGLKKQIIFVIISLAITGIQFIHKAIK